MSTIQAARYSIILICCALLSCNKDSGTVPPIVPNPVISFSTDFSIGEGQRNVPILLTSSSPITAGTITITVTPVNGLEIGEGKDLLITPAPLANTITLTGISTPVSFSISSLLQTQVEGNKGVTFSIATVPSGVDIGSKSTLTVTIEDSSLGNGIVAEYLFDGDAFDTSGKGHNGTVNGASLSNDKTGKPNSAYSFNGSTFIEVANNSDINFVREQDFSISVWASASNTQNDMAGTINNVMRKWVGDAQGYPFAVSYFNSSHATTPRTYLGVRYDGSACGSIPYITSAVVNSDFKHIVFMRSAGTLELYINGVKVAQGSDFTSCQTTNISNLYIGCSGGVTQRCFTGTIDDIRIYNRVLTSSEIGILFAN
jgi:hypothetical protein